MFKFIKSIGHEMRLTTWPKRTQAWHDFVMVVEYTVFFLIFIMIFDWFSSNALHGILNFALHNFPKI